MSLSDDEWIKSHSPIVAEKLHALGVVTLHWNECESWLLTLLNQLIDMEWKEFWALFSQLGDVAISERIRSVLKIRQFSPALIARIENALQVYENCRLNRNQLTHFAVKREARQLILRRKSKKPDDDRTDPFLNELSDIRRVADEIIECSTYLSHIVVTIDAFGPQTRHPWPEKRDVPTLLWSPPPQTHAKPRHPPKSSRASRRKVEISGKT
jgi:hypothetical protein